MTSAGEAGQDVAYDDATSRFYAKEAQASKAALTRVVGGPGLWSRRASLNDAAPSYQAAARPFSSPARNSRRSAALPPLTITGLSAARRIGRSSRLSV